jgi:periplasmic copper chaperone A
VTARRLAALAALAVLAACGGSSGGDDAGVSVTDAWARPTPAATTTAAVYFDVATDDADLLVGASVPTDVAASTALHMSMVGASGDAAMHEMGPLDVPSGGSVTFEPGANHVMLNDLVEPLVAGDQFDLTLEFESAGEQVVTVDVRDE